MQDGKQNRSKPPKAILCHAQSTCETDSRHLPAISSSLSNQPNFLALQLDCIKRVIAALYKLLSISREAERRGLGW
jgi:hypothetical protein